MTGRKIKHQRLDKGLINIKGQLGLKRVGGRESGRMPKKDLILSLKCHDNSKKEHLKRQTWREKTRGGKGGRGWMTMGMRSDFPSTELQIFPCCIPMVTRDKQFVYSVVSDRLTFMRRCLMPRRSTVDEFKSNPEARLVRKVTPPSPHSQKKPRLHNVVIKDL